MHPSDVPASDPTAFKQGSQSVEALNGGELLLRRALGQPKSGMFSVWEGQKNGMSFFYDSLRSVGESVAPSDATWAIDNTPEYTLPRKGAKTGSAEDTRVSRCNSVERLSFGSTLLATCV